MIKDESFILNIPKDLSEEDFLFIIELLEQKIIKETKKSCFTNSYDKTYSHYIGQINDSNVINDKLGWAFNINNPYETLKYIGYCHMSYLMRDPVRFGKVYNLIDFFELDFKSFWHKIYYFKSVSSLQNELLVIEKSKLKDKEARINAIKELLEERK